MADPFLLTIEDKHWLNNNGAVFVGYVERGSAQAGDLVDVLGPEETITLPVTSIERPDATNVIAHPGDLVAVLLEGITREAFESTVKVGHLIAQADTIHLGTRFRADLTVLSTEEGGRPEGLAINMESLCVHIYGMTTMCRRITFTSDSGALPPGQHAEVVLDTFPIPVEEGTPLMIRVGRHWVARGTVTERL